MGNMYRVYGMNGITFMAVKHPGGEWAIVGKEAALLLETDSQHDARQAALDYEKEWFDKE